MLGSHKELLHFKVTVNQKYHQGTCHPFAGLDWHSHLEILILFFLIPLPACSLREFLVSEK